MRERHNWIRGHPPYCTCVDCRSEAPLEPVRHEQEAPDLPWPSESPSAVSETPTAPQRRVEPKPFTSRRAKRAAKASGGKLSVAFGLAIQAIMAAAVVAILALYLLTS